VRSIAGCSFLANKKKVSTKLPLNYIILFQVSGVIVAGRCSTAWLRDCVTENERMEKDLKTTSSLKFARITSFLARSLSHGVEGRKRVVRHVSNTFDLIYYFESLPTFSATACAKTVREHHFLIQYFNFCVNYDDMANVSIGNEFSRFCNEFSLIAKGDLFSRWSIRNRLLVEILNFQSSSLVETRTFTIYPLSAWWGALRVN
jgi:hypothetical protein